MGEALFRYNSDKIRLKQGFSVTEKKQKWDSDVVQVGGRQNFIEKAELDSMLAMCYVWCVVNKVTHRHVLSEYVGLDVGTIPPYSFINHCCCTYLNN